MQIRNAAASCSRSTFSETGNWRRTFRLETQSKPHIDLSSWQTVAQQQGSHGLPTASFYNIIVATSALYPSKSAKRPMSMWSERRTSGSVPAPSIKSYFPRIKLNLHVWIVPVWRPYRCFRHNNVLCRPAMILCGNPIKVRSYTNWGRLHHEFGEKVKGT